MKAIKKIVAASCALVMAVGISVGASFAWIGAAQSQVTVSGMNVNMEVPDGIAISSTFDGLSDKRATASLTLPTGYKLAPAMYVATDTTETYKMDASTNLDVGDLYTHANLLTVTNPANIDTATGRAKVVDGNPLPLYYELGAVGREDDSGRTLNCLEVGVYIAATTAAIEGQNIKATLETTTSDLADIYKCLTVDFYSATTTAAIAPKSSSSFTGVKYLAETNGNSLAKFGLTQSSSKRTGTVNLFTGRTTKGLVFDGSVAGAKIPLAGSGSALAVWMRIYFDGSLTGDSGLFCTSENAASVTTAGVDFTITFELESI